MLRLEPKGKPLNDGDNLSALGIQSGSKIYVKDLGPQIGWGTVFLAEYAGPLLIYVWMYTRPWIFYGSNAADKPYAQVVQYVYIIIIIIIYNRFRNIQWLLFVLGFNTNNSVLLLQYRSWMLGTALCQEVTGDHICPSIFSCNYAFE